ncbi:3-hydroxyacyl-ACP dehydratase FabZ family protein [Jiangella gansuensis]|uniref:3-hydroxyacyl-ACP dehydratase FabZ family protein n=1 Tax=Jiangella gansuensis TaxID=281473 RepID=UPI0004ACB20F|nr:hypothetical protein [Jiangella gansuensis]
MTTPLLDRTDLVRAAELAGLDTVLALEPGARGKATRNVPSTSAIFATHFPRFPVLPGVLILDDLARLAALVVDGAGSPERWSLAGATRIRYRRYVRPGDVAELSVEVVPGASDPVLRGTVRVDGAVVTTVGALTLRETATGGAA